MQSPASDRYLPRATRSAFGWSGLRQVGKTYDDKAQPMTIPDQTHFAA